jgi:hypothetical protein
MISSIDPSTLTDIIHLSADSWQALDGESVKTPAEYEKIRRYYIDVAEYNRKLALLLQGHFEAFDDIDDTPFNDEVRLGNWSKKIIAAEKLSSLYSSLAA